MTITWPADGQVGALSFPRQAGTNSPNGGLVGLSKKSEPRTWNREHLTAGASLDRATMRPPKIVENKSQHVFLSPYPLAS